MADEETEETGTAPEGSDDERFTERVRGIVSEAIDSLLGSGKARVVDDEETGESEAKPKARRTYRDEEEGMSSLVEKKVKELLAKEKASGERHDEGKASTEHKAPPEPVPAQSPRRRVERLMDW